MNFVQLFGRLHPMVLHIPIGMLSALAALELFAFVRKEALPRAFAGLLVWMCALAAAFTALSGFTLSREGGYDETFATRHMWLGIGLAVSCLALAIVHTRGNVKLYRALFAWTLLVMLPTGHLGATLTHGENWLGGSPPVESKPLLVPAMLNADPILTFFAARCTSCHGETKKKGGLALHNAAAVLAGGEDGPVIVPGPGVSELVHRLRLPLEEDGHMPPKGKPQPTEAEIRALEAWIASGAKFALAETSPAPVALATLVVPPAPVAPRVPDPKALAALANELVHVERIAGESNLLWIDFAATAPKVKDEDVARLIEPLREFVAELSLARSAISDASCALFARIPNLYRLDLRSTAVGDAGIAKLEQHAKLAELVLARTKITDASIDVLLALPALDRLYVWGAPITADGLAHLRQGRATLKVDAGDAPKAEALDKEGEIKLTSDAPIPGAKPAEAPTAAAASLVPINTICPVSGKPVDPNYTIVFKGRVIGFCCQHCPGDFWADPEKYASKLP